MKVEPIGERHATHGAGRMGLALALLWGGAMPVLFLAHCHDRDLTCDDTLTCVDAAGSPKATDDASASTTQDASTMDAGQAEAALPVLKDASSSAESSPSAADGSEAPEATTGGADSGAPDDAGPTDASGDASLGDAKTEPPVCDPAASPSDMPCLISDEYGVFVSPDGVDDDARGTLLAPVRTIAKASQLAKSLGKRVYACGTKGSFAEPIVIDENLDDGLRLYGGFDCENWRVSARVDQRTRIQTSAAGQVPLTIVNVRNAPLIIEGFHFIAAAGQQPGQSSIAALVSSSRAIRFTKVTFQAGAGANGQRASAPASNYNDVAPDDTRIKGRSPQGASGGAEQSCQDLCIGSQSHSTGGRGGMGDSLSPTSGGDGKPAQGTVYPPGATGKGGVAGSVCASGGRGADGSDAPTAHGGAGATWFGTLSREGWSPMNGGPGTRGGPGQGGGGGAGGKTTDATKGGGGGGGCGGCGGAAGLGGGGGGSSFGLLSYQSEMLRLESCMLKTDNGGLGGAGSDGQDGQPGGDSGFDNAPGCFGGSGGKGGGGGGGGGGAAGLSVGVGYVGASPAVDDDTSWFGGVALCGAPGGVGGGESSVLDAGVIADSGTGCGGGGADAGNGDNSGRGTPGIKGEVASTYNLSPPH